VWTLLRGDPAEVARRAHEQDMRVNVWTVNEPEQLRVLREAGIDAVVTDVPDVALGVLGA
jgi:glycerophosphoryl diester phosphodiesterase